MGRLGDTLDALTVKALSPDQRIQGSLRSRNSIEISFVDDDSYYEYESEEKLASQLSSVANAIFRARLDGFRAAVREVTNLTIDDTPHWDARRRRFREERDTTLLKGTSTDGWIGVTSTGLHDAKVSIESGAFDELDVRAFEAELKTAISDLWEDHAFVIRHLKHVHLR